jgi:hypothetical protein
VIGEERIGGFDASSIADHASTCFGSARVHVRRDDVADLLIDIFYHFREIRLNDQLVEPPVQ